MNKGKFVFYESVYKQMERLEKMLGIEKAYAFTKAVMDYGLYGVVPEDDNELWLYGLEQIFTSIDAAQQRYEKNIEDGGKGGRPQKEIDMDLFKYAVELIEDTQQKNISLGKQIIRNCKLAQILSINKDAD